MYSKFIEGLSLIIGMCILMHALFSDDGHRTLAQNVVEIKPTRRIPPQKRQMAYMAFGSSLLVYGLAELVLRGL